MANWYQSFTRFADGTWDYEFHRQGCHPDFVIRAYSSNRPEWGWLYKPFRTRWHYDAISNFRTSGVVTKN